MEDVIQGTQDKLAQVAGLKYVDEDWGQLDYYSPNFPVKWPCALVDVVQADYQNVGRDRSATPQNRQMANGMLSITLANMRLSNTGAKAPQSQKDNAWSIHGLIRQIHEILHGFCPTEKSGPLMRTGLRRVRRDDGVQEYRILYGFGMTDV